MTADNALIDHVESTLGPIDSGWRDEQSDSGLVVGRVPQQPYAGVFTYVTLGLSRHVLPLDSQRTVRQELLVSAEEQFNPEDVASFLETFAELVSSEHRALLRGHTVGPSEPVIPGVEIDAVYAAIPLLYDDRLQVFRGTDPPTVFVWVVPIYRVELEFVRAEGWEAFEDRLEESNPNLCDLLREPVV